MCNCVIDNSMVNKRFIPQIKTPEIKANWKDYQVEDAFLSMKGDKKKWSEVAYTLKYAGNNAITVFTTDYYSIFYR